MYPKTFTAACTINVHIYKYTKYTQKHAQEMYTKPYTITSNMHKNVHKI